MNGDAEKIEFLAGSVIIGLVAKMRSMSSATTTSNSFAGCSAHQRNEAGTILC